VGVEPESPADDDRGHVERQPDGTVAIVRPGYGWLGPALASAITLEEYARQRDEITYLNNSNRRGDRR
jgi:hypothetical protein